MELEKLKRLVYTFPAEFNDNVEPKRGRLKIPPSLLLLSQIDRWGNCSPSIESFLHMGIVVFQNTGSIFYCLCFKGISFYPIINSFAKPFLMTPGCDVAIQLRPLNLVYFSLFGIHSSTLADSAYTAGWYLNPHATILFLDTLTGDNCTLL